MEKKFKRVKTKIVATLGPATSNYEMIKALVEAGATMFRLNTSHGSEEGHAQNIAYIRQVSKETGRYIPILIDLQGPKIRVGNIPNPIAIKEGQEIILEATDDVNNPEILPVDYEGIADDVKAGDKILLDDGKIGLQVVEVKDTKVRAKVLYGTEIRPRKGINLPGSTASLDAVTERDKEFIRFAVEYDADYLALSFVREAKDIELAKKYTQDFGGKIPVIAKIEKPQAVEKLDEILKVSDGIMVARGDLGIEMSPEEVPIVQKDIIRKANMNRKEIDLLLSRMEGLKSFLENNSLERFQQEILRVENFLKRFGSLSELLSHLENVEKIAYLAKDFLSIDEVAAYLQVSKSYVYKLTMQKEFTVYKPNGKNIFILRDDVNQWVKRNPSFSNQEIERQANIIAYALEQKNRNKSTKGGKK